MLVRLISFVSFFGRNGERPVVREMDASGLTTPMSVQWGTRPTMASSVDASDDVQEKAKKSYTEKVRSNMDTENLGAILARFHKAVSWRD